MQTPTEEEQRRRWRWQWLTAIGAFANAEVQRDRWTDPNERNPYFSFVECMCSYFDDALMSDEGAFERRMKAGHLSSEEAAVTVEFHAAAGAYGPPHDDDWAIKAILADPAWQKVVALAQEAQCRLLPLLSDQGDRAALTEPLEWREEAGIFSPVLNDIAYVR